MNKNNSRLPDLSKPEYAVMQVLWKKGRQSVSEVHKALEPVYGWALTTVRTMMERMVNKDLISKKSFHGIFLFDVLVSRPAGLVKMIKFFAERVLETDPTSVAAMFSDASDLSSEELQELKRLLNEEK